MNPIAAFRNMQEELKRSYNLPLPVTICVKALSGIHWVWWFCRKKEMIKPENIVPAALGSILEGGLRFVPNVVEQAVRGVAKLILVATRIDECVQRMKSLGEAFVEFKNAVTGKFPLVLEPHWIKKSNSIIFSPHSINQLKFFGKQLHFLARRVSFCVANIFVRFFKLSMQLWDTYHAFVFSHDAIPEVFVNSMYWFHKIRHNKDYINSKLDEYRFFIQKIFEATRTSVSADHLIDSTKNLLNHTVKGIETVENIHEFMGNKILTPVKKVIRVIKSKLLGKELEKRRPNTPFVLKRLPTIAWVDNPSKRANLWK